ncbi:MAG: dienelactone hydrolase family protein [Nitrososphaerales archaeon]
MEKFRSILGRLNWLQRYLVEEYVEDYQEGALTRREALKYLGAVLGSAAAATTVLAACAPMPAPTGATTGATATLAPSAEAAATAAPATAVATADVSTGAPTETATAGVSPSPTPEQVRATATATVLATTDTTASPTPIPVPAGVNVPPDDPSLEAQDLTFPGSGLDIVAYMAKPKGQGPFPAILVCHENRGLTDHIKDVTRRVAKAGYVGLAVDLLSSQGGTAKVSDPAQIPNILSSTPPDTLAGYFLSAIQYLQAQPFVNKDQLGMVGFCFGGGMTWLVATKAPQLKAAVPFYGPNPPLEAVPNIRAAVLGIYGGEDQRINAGIPAIEEAMQKNGKIFEKVIYPGASHAFHNDTGRNYNPEAAVDAWKRTLAWFEKYVKG